MGKKIVMRGFISILAIGSMALIACSSDNKSDGFEETDKYTPYEPAPEDSVIITGEATYVGPTEVVPEEGELTVGDETIDTTEGKFCSDAEAKMDVIVVDGEVVDVICYPPPTEENMTEVVADKQGDTEVPQNANDTVIVFDEATDGKIIEGDISVDGNNVAIYGNGPENTIIEGDLVLNGNNARVRGVRIKGNVIMDLNNIALLFCVVEGNIEVRDNNVTIAATDVMGNLIVTGNNAVLVQNRVQGNLEMEGKESYCDGNLAFEDKDSDLTVDDNEIGDPINCGE